MRITVTTFIIFSLIVQGHGRPLQPGQGSKYSEDLPLMRSLPGKKESRLAGWFRNTSDKFWNSVIPGRPTLAKVVVAGASFFAIALGLGLYLFIYVYRKVHPEYVKLETELLQGKRVFRPESPPGLYSKIAQKLVPKKHRVVKQKRDIEEGDDEKDQNRHPFLSWLMAAPGYIVENEQEREESEDDRADEEERKDVKPKKGKQEKEEKSTAMKDKYVARMRRLKSQIKNKKVAIKKQVKETKTILAKKAKNIKIKKAKKTLAKKAKKIKVKAAKNIKVKAAKNMAKRTKKTMVKKMKKIRKIKKIKIKRRK
ncbi:uncharacterized protein LOC142659051 [Rhinoderma darwinii]|uniref:uncharacterized protein LOC142659051 n=1 Tax=Rhinoderma darwinii TaxID=43563 RepID=UPI003F666A41